MAVQNVDEDIARVLVVLIGADIDKLIFVWRFALGLRVSKAHIDRKIAELKFANQLRIDQLPLIPACVLGNQAVSVEQKLTKPQP